MASTLVPRTLLQAALQHDSIFFFAPGASYPFIPLGLYCSNPFYDLYPLLYNPELTTHTRPLAVYFFFIYTCLLFICIPSSQSPSQLSIFLLNKNFF